MRHKHAMRHQHSLGRGHSCRDLHVSFASASFATAGQSLQVVMGVVEMAVALEAARAAVARVAEMAVVR